ncbi:GNAT family N-acetyltransferase [Citrobacter youngae]|uniref:Acetyltransferase, GNAT family n=1 Tax=Citrobacter youngae ATCC 29220 TaxID=500640 RepID=D4B9M0_9ENTR|nr:GNAT family N-acetyltransferase [Citrobacter youngae]EFE08881.1 acetyltransferase, GNAT family [Citrobacter youngae ATCC 29220]
MLETPRLIIRQWEDKDREPFAALNADPDVMRFFPSPLQKAESDLLADRFSDGIEARGWGFWAVELKETHQFVGSVGLHPQPDKFSFSPCTEIGWRLAKAYWHQGLATEAAEACLTFAFEELRLNEVVSFTSVLNKPSERLMKRLGMKKIAEFAHPALPAEHILAQHVLYQIEFK